MVANTSLEGNFFLGTFGWVEVDDFEVVDDLTTIIQTVMTYVQLLSMHTLLQDTRNLAEFVTLAHVYVFCCTGEKVTEHDKATFLREKKPATHSGSFVRNSGARLSWRMVPSENRRSGSTPEKKADAGEESSKPAIVATAEVVAITEDKEIVLREVDGEQLPAPVHDESGAIFSSIVAISMTTDHQNQTSHAEADKNERNH